LLTDDLEDQGAVGSVVLSPNINLQGAVLGARNFFIPSPKRQHVNHLKNRNRQSKTKGKDNIRRE
jgi:hypothetical protein